jgi:hypothetical protein
MARANVRALVLILGLAAAECAPRAVVPVDDTLASSCDSGPLRSCFPMANTVTRRVEVETVYPATAGAATWGRRRMTVTDYYLPNWCADNATCEEEIGPCLVRRDPAVPPLDTLPEGLLRGVWRVDPLADALTTHFGFSDDMERVRSGLLAGVAIPVAPGAELTLVAYEFGGREYLRERVTQPPTARFLAPQPTGLDSRIEDEAYLVVPPGAPLRARWEGAPEGTMLLEVGFRFNGRDRSRAKCYFRASAGEGAVPAAVLARFAGRTDERYFRMGTIDEHVRTQPSEITGTQPLAVAAVNVLLWAQLEIR